MDSKKNICKEIVIAGFIPALFIITVSITKNYTAPSTGRFLLFNAAAIAFLAAFFIMVVMFLKQQGGVIAFIKKHKEIIIVLLLALLLRLPSIGDLPKWDAQEYYYRLTNTMGAFNFHLTNFVHTYTICNHTSMAYMAIAAIGEMLFPKKVIGISLVNLILALVATCFVYDMLSGGEKGKRKVMAALGALCFSVTPMFLGTYAHFNLDYGLAIFFIYTVYAGYKKQYILMFFWSMCMCFSKETGILVVGGYMIGIVLYAFIKQKGSLKQRIVNVLKERVFWVAALLLGCFLVYLIKNHGLGWQPSTTAESTNVFTWDNEGMNCFGWNPSYILCKLKQMFLLNFMWIPTGVIILCVITIIRRNITVSKEKQVLITGLIFGGFFHSIYSMFFITAAIARYNVVMENILVLLALILTWECLASEKEKIIKGAVSFISLLFLVQAYITIDPVSLLVFEKMETGGWPLLYTAYGENQYGEVLIYNRQFHYLDVLTDEILEAIAYGENMFFIEPDCSRSLYVQGNPTIGCYNWSEEKGIRTFISGDGYYYIHSVSHEDFQKSEVREIFDGYEAYMVIAPYYLLNEEEELEKIAEYYEPVERYEVKNIYGSLVYYKLQQK